jgi:hypothetical protein
LKPELPAATRQKRGFWRTCRLCFRGLRIAVLLLILVLLGALIYLTEVGLPDLAKKPLLESLRARGLDLQFSRLRLTWYRGIVAENVRFGRADDPQSPELTVAQVRLRLDHRALARLRIQVDSLALRQGSLVWRLAETDQAPRQLALDNIQTELRFLPDDVWALDQFTAGFAGARILLSGTLTHASAVRDWKLLKAEHPAPAGAWRNRLREFADTLERIHFSAPPVLRLDVRGDARDLGSFGLRVLLDTPGADTPWGTVNQGRFSARLFPATTNGLSSAELSLEAGEARTRWATNSNLQLTARLASFESLTNWGNADLNLRAGDVATQWGRTTNLQLTLRGASIEGQTNLIRADLALWAGRAETRWGSATNAQFNAQWIHALTNAIPLSGDAKLRCNSANTDWGAAGELQLHLHLTDPPAAATPRADASWAWWAKLEPYVLDWDCQAHGLQSRGLQVEEVACAGSWRAPELTITNLHADMHQRHLDVRAGLDVATRALDLNVASDVDPHLAEPALPESARQWLAAFSWEQPPDVKGEVSLVLPAWTNRAPDWAAEVLPTLRLQGEFKVPHGGAYRGVPVSAAQSHISYSNMVWRLPDLTVMRPEGALEVVHEEDDRTKDFYFRISSTLDVRILRPLLEPEQRSGFDLFTFTTPPLIGVEIWGRGRDPERTRFKGRLALTNFTFRGETVSGLQTAFQYTNRILLFTDPRLQRGAQQASADALAADFGAQKIFLTNGYSTTEPMFIARVIGTNVVRAVEPYQFRLPPVAHVQGIIPMHGEEDADLHFDLDGGPFDWWRFHVPRIAGHVHWLGQHLTLSNVWVDFYGGPAPRSARFDFSPRDQTDYQFTLATTNALLQPLVRDLFLKTNHLDGRLTGTLVVTSADTADMRSWNGHGNVALRDGLIWEIPIFGIFSDVLNGMAPGLGSSRASAAAGTFIITNGIIRSDDLDIRSTGMRLQYRGTLDFEGRVNARVEAGLLRDMWLLGPIVSTVLWPVTKLFEYKVTGNLDDPKAEPVYLISKAMLLPFQLPFHPIRTLKGLLPEDLGSSHTNAPPNAPK